MQRKLDGAILLCVDYSIAGTNNCPCQQPLQLVVFTSSHVVYQTFLKRRPKSDQKGNISLLKDHGLLKKTVLE